MSMQCWLSRNWLLISLIRRLPFCRVTSFKIKVFKKTCLIFKGLFSCRNPRFPERVLHAVDADAARVIGADELAHDVHAAAGALLDLHLRHNDRLLEHCATLATCRDTTRAVRVYVTRVTCFTLECWHSDWLFLISPSFIHKCLQFRSLRIFNFIVSCRFQNLLVSNLDFTWKKISFSALFFLQ